jgi:radical SAM superfamily enzyme with C-terminal helix-hairpin-helix motif
MIRSNNKNVSNTCIFIIVICNQKKKKKKKEEEVNFIENIFHYSFSQKRFSRAQGMISFKKAKNKTPTLL